MRGSKNGLSYDATTDERPETRSDPIGPVPFSGIVTRAVRKRPLIAFFVITFLYSWGLFAVLYGLLGPERIAATRTIHAPFAWGPALAALVTIHLRGGDVRSWLLRVADPRANIKWYAVAVLAALGFTNGDIAAGLVGIDLQLANSTRDIVTVFVFSLVVAGGLEEFGWRGLAQPELQVRYDAFTAAVLVGLAWGVWHYPVVVLGAGYENAGFGTLATFTLGTVLMSVIFAWLFNGSGGVVPVVMLAHATVNATPILEAIPTAPEWVGLVQAGLLLGVVAFPVLAYGRGDLAPSNPTTEVLAHVRGDGS